MKPPFFSSYQFIGYSIDSCKKQRFKQDAGPKNAAVVYIPKHKLINVVNKVKLFSLIALSWKWNLFMKGSHQEKHLRKSNI